MWSFNARAVFSPCLASCVLTRDTRFGVIHVFTSNMWHLRGRQKLHWDWKWCCPTGWLAPEQRRRWIEAGKRRELRGRGETERGRVNTAGGRWSARRATGRRGWRREGVGEKKNRGEMVCLCPWKDQRGAQEQGKEMQKNLWMKRRSRMRFYLKLAPAGGLFSADSKTIVCHTVPADTWSNVCVVPQTKQEQVHLLYHRRGAPKAQKRSCSPFLPLWLFPLSRIELLLDDATKWKEADYDRNWEERVKQEGRSVRSRCVQSSEKAPRELATPRLLWWHERWTLPSVVPPSTSCDLV